MHHQDELKRIIEEVLKCTFIYADLFTANNNLDKLPEISFPIFIYVAPSKKKNSADELTAMIKRVVPINGFFLYKVPQKTGEVVYDDLKPWIRKAEVLADKLYRALNASSLKDPNKKFLDYESQDTYDEFDQSLHGVTFFANWPVDELTRGCV